MLIESSRLISRFILVGAIAFALVGCRDGDGDDALGKIKDPGKKAVSIVQKAVKKGRAKQPIDTELQQLDRLVELAPDNVKVLAAAAYLSFAEGMRLAEAKDLDKSTPLLEAALLHMQKVEDSGETSAQIEQLRDEIYLNAARVISMNGNADRTMELLQRAASTGFVDPDLLTIDVAFNTVKDRDDFKSLIAKLSKALIDFEFDFSLQDADGDTFTMSDYSGKVVVANFWGTWCPPCRMEIPDFVELQKEYKDRGVQFVGLTYENGAPRPKVVELLNKFTNNNQMNYPLLVGEQSVLEQVPHLQSFPTTLIIDRAGKVQKRVSGMMTKSRLEKILLPLLNEKPSEEVGKPKKTGSNKTDD